MRRGDSEPVAISCRSCLLNNSGPSCDINMHSINFTKITSLLCTDQNTWSLKCTMCYTHCCKHYSQRNVHNHGYRSRHRDVSVSRADVSVSVSTFQVSSPLVFSLKFYLRRVVTKTISPHKLNRCVNNNPCRMQLPAELYYLYFNVVIYDVNCACASIYC